VCYLWRAWGTVTSTSVGLGLGTCLQSLRDRTVRGGLEVEPRRPVWFRLVGHWAAWLLGGSLHGWQAAWFRKLRKRDAAPSPFRFHHSPVTLSSFLLPTPAPLAHTPPPYPHPTPTLYPFLHMCVISLWRLRVYALGVWSRQVYHDC
jgi:hypothetical protein